MAQQLGLAEIGGIAAGVALLLLTVVGALRMARYGRDFDARVVAKVAACFAELARLRGLELTPARPYHHPMIGEVPQAPSLSGVAQGLRFSLALESEPSGDEVLEMTLRIAPPAAGVWPRLQRPCRDATGLHPAARSAVSALCEQSTRVEIGPGGLVAVPRAKLAAGWITREYRVELDPARLDAWLGLALAVPPVLDVTVRA